MTYREDFTTYSPDTALPTNVRIDERTLQSAGGKENLCCRNHVGESAGEPASRSSGRQGSPQEQESRQAEQGVKTARDSIFLMLRSGPIPVPSRSHPGLAPGTQHSWVSPGLWLRGRKVGRESVARDTQSFS